MTFNSPLVTLAIEKSGGLFDFDGTLPTIALEFILFMISLNIILYTPLLETIDERNIYIKKSLKNASSILAKSNKLNTQYEEETAKVRNAAKLDIITYQKLYKDILENKMKSSQIYIDKFINETTISFDTNKESILISLDNEIDSISNEIISKVLI